jgi:ribosome-binding factor A
MRNVKLERTNSDIFRILSITLRDKMREDFTNVTILGVETSADYSVAKVFVEIAGDEVMKKRTFAELDKAGGFLRNEVANRVKLRLTPQLRFILDRGRENTARVEELLLQIKKEGK